MSGEPPLLELRGLSVSGDQPILHGLDLAIGRGERVGLIGRSGSGKSLTALSCLGLLPRGLSFGASEILLDDVDLLKIPESERLRLRGPRVAMVFQQASAALNPVWSIGFQLRELCHLYYPERDASLIVQEMMGCVGLIEPGILRAYPHELSGGQRQRVLLAMALVGEPELLLADEITASLDLMSQTEILKLLDRLCQERHLALLMISHDLSTVIPRVDRVMVIEEGFLVEEAPVELFKNQPLHPLSRRFLQASRGERLTAEASRPRTGGGCPYASRCALAIPECAAAVPPLVDFGQGLRCRCLRAGESH